MSIGLLVYLVSVVGNLHMAADAMFITGMMILGIGTIARMFYYGLIIDDFKSFKLFPGFMIAILSVTFLFGAANVFTPDRETMILIAGLETANTVLNTDEAKEITGKGGEVIKNSLDLLNKYLIEQTKVETND